MCKFESGIKNLHFVFGKLLKAFLTFNITKLLHKVHSYFFLAIFSINEPLSSMN